MPVPQLKSLAHDDDDLYDMTKGMPDGYEPPDYPQGLCFGMSMETLSRAGGDGMRPDDRMPFSLMAEVTSVYLGRDNCRIEVEGSRFAGPDGKFFDLPGPVHLCLTGSELGKMELDGDAERGDTIHLIGTARMESISSSEWGGDTAMFQVTDLTFEDESSETRRGA